MRTRILSLVCLAAAVAQAANPVTNGGFEKVGADGKASGWEQMGDTTVRTERAAAGTRALRLLRGPETKGETGLNRTWEFRSGRQDSMLAETKGAVRFRYFAVAQEKPGALAMQIIPMTEKCLEFGGKRTVWRVPSAHVGDGEWHVGEYAYDYTNFGDVHWVHVSARLLAAGELWLDEIEWVPEGDAVPQITALEFIEEKGREGRAGHLAVTLRNLGSKPMPAGQATMTLPAGLASPQVSIATPVLPANETTTVKLPVLGLRTAPSYELRFALQAGGKTATGELVLEAGTALQSLQCEALIVRPGQPTQVDLLARNTGHVMVHAVPCEFSGPAGVKIERLPLPAALAPGLVAPVASWRVTVPEISPLVRLRAVPGGDSKPVETQLVAAELGRPPSTAGKPAEVKIASGWQIIGSDKARLAIFPIADNVRGALLQVRRGRRWQTVAILPRLGLLRTPQGEGAMAFADTTFIRGRKGASLRLTGQTVIGDARWQAVCELRVAAHADTIDYQLTATPLDGGQYLALEGPMLYAGDGLPERDDAVLPGLEWLVRGEMSSSALDIKPDHPDCVRYVPHPLKITVPAAGMRFGDVAVGLHWPAPPKQASYELAGSQSLVFASPNRFEGHKSHLVGLMLPGVDHGLPENTRLAEEPLDCAGKPLVIKGTLVASTGATDSLVPLDRWYQAHGFPAALPFPRGTAAEEIGFSLQAYAKDKALWNEKWKKWYSDIIVGFRPTLDPAYELLMGAKFLAGKPVAAWAQALAQEALGGDKQKAKECLAYRMSAESVRNLVHSALVAVSRQQPDGNWVFGGEKAADDWPEEGVDYGKLGPKGARAVGFSAANAKRVLDAALLSGNAELREAGLRALAGMRQFRVPRAAQVWEVPAHTPDILASGRTVDAYLAGYRLTGEREYLDEAIYWARTGLPFVYVWAPADQPLVQGTTIPVFGATSYVLSWFAVAVQWNGLCYSQALYDLAEYDQSFPWQKVADNILVSGMYQQATEGDRLAQWPDAINLIKGRKGLHGQTPPCFRPTTLINQTLLGMGIRRHPQSVVLRQGRQQLVLRTTAQIRDASWRGKLVSFRARFVAPVSGDVALLGVDQPSQVLVNGAPAPADSWEWHQAEAMLVLNLPRSSTYRVVVEGVRARAGKWIADPLRTIDFRFEKGVQGWQATHDLMPLAVDDGMLATTTSGGDPYMAHDGFVVAARPGDVLEVELTLAPGPEPAPVSVFWGTDAAPG
ncbi:MAG: hypothetical protein HN904_22735, partial [Victivallales bacterium]|nr:hypothetical protein [Victivallales bacterium]